MATVLLVEDEAALRHVLRRALLLAGFDVHDVAGGAEALSLLENLVPDIVVTDLVMPRITGAALARAIAADPRLMHLPVIIMSGTADATIPMGYPVLEKPFPLRLLVETVNQILVQQ